MHRYITLAQVSTHSQASGLPFSVQKKADQCSQWRVWNKSSGIVCFQRKHAAGEGDIVLENQSRYQLFAAAGMCSLWIELMTQPEQRWFQKMIVRTNWLCWTLVCLIWFVSFTRMYSLRPSLKMLHEIFLLHFYQWFLLHFYHSDFLRRLQFPHRWGSAHRRKITTPRTSFQLISMSRVIFHIKTHIFEYLCFCIGFSNPVYKCMIRQFCVLLLHVNKRFLLTDD